jgi:hypothetical protein
VTGVQTCALPISIRNSVLVSDEFQILAIPFSFMSMDLGIDTPTNLCCSLVVS